MMTWFGGVRPARRIKLAIMIWRMRRLIRGGLGLGLLSRMPVGNSFLLVGIGTRLIRDLHRFFTAISRAVVNDDGKGGTAPDPLVW